MAGIEVDVGQGRRASDPESLEMIQWLSEDEDRAWRAFLEAAGRVTQALDSRLKSDAQLTLDDYDVLVHLSEASSSRLRMTELSERLLHSQSRLTQRVDRLEKRGLVRRQRSSEDRRVIFAVLTEEGSSAISSAAPNHLRDVREVLLSQLETSELAVLATALERVAQNLRPE